jgi:hypothetical protein
VSRQEDRQKKRRLVQVGFLIELELDKFVEFYATAKGVTKTDIFKWALYEYLYRRGYVVKVEGNKYVLAPDAVARLARRIAASAAREQLAAR